MAPTEILARQHFYYQKNYLDYLQVDLLSSKSELKIEKF